MGTSRVRGDARARMEVQPGIFFGDTPGIPTSEREPRSGVASSASSMGEGNKERVLGRRLRKVDRVSSATISIGGRARVMKAGLALFVVVLAGVLLRNFATCLLRIRNKSREPGRFGSTAGTAFRRLAGLSSEEETTDEECSSEEEVLSSSKRDAVVPGRRREGLAETGVFPSRTDDAALAAWRLGLKRHIFQRQYGLVLHPGEKAEVLEKPSLLNPTPFSRERQRELRADFAGALAYLSDVAESIAEDGAELSPPPSAGGEGSPEEGGRGALNVSEAGTGAAGSVDTSSVEEAASLVDALHIHQRGKSSSR